MKIINYKPINKGSLKGSFDLILVLDKTCSGSELVVHDCKLFEKDGRRWVGFPSRPYQSKENETKYAPYVSVENKEFKSKIDAECLRQLDALVVEIEPVPEPVKSCSFSEEIPF